MKRSLVVSVPMAVFGFLLAAIPLRLLPVCAVHEGTVPMRCHWSGMVLAGFGGAYFFLAAILFLQQNSLVRIGISTTAIVLSATAAMMPTYLVGMCGSPAMPCRTGTYPAVLIVLAFLASAGVFNIFYLRERRGDEAPYNLAHSGNQS